ncbi:DUF2892 domain-containing protein [Nocardia sp. NBC_01009]|uniref:DUF2892 domain-containing protein n=1 Tax=Nocardia sp. NBC_01009 TaxID=2975996 RepID=UPI00386877EA|nr:DUF2892 domain-containing protein [Nocardia sp. NBC_01009]
MSLPSRPRAWTIDRVGPLLAGILILTSAALAAALSPWWLLLTVLVEANLLLYSALDWCPASLLMARLGIPAGTATCAVPRT